MLKLNFSNIKPSFSSIALNQEFNNMNISEFMNNSTIKSNYSFFNKLTIKTFAKKANKRKGEEVKNNDNDNDNYNNKKHPRKKSNTVKSILGKGEKTNKSDDADLENYSDLKENNKSQIRADANNSNKAKSEEANSENKSVDNANNNYAEILKCMIIHPVFSDR